VSRMSPPRGGVGTAALALGRMTDDAITAQLVAQLVDRGGRAPHPPGYATLWRSTVPEEHLAAVEDWAVRHAAVYVPPETGAHWIVPLDVIADH